MDVDEHLSLVSSNDESAIDLAEVSANVAMYRGQLEEVQRSLQLDPNDATALEIRSALEEVLQLSVDLLTPHVSLPDPLSHPPVTDDLPSRTSNEVACTLFPTESQPPQGTSSDVAETQNVNTPPPSSRHKRKFSDREGEGEEVHDSPTTKRPKATAHVPPHHADSASLPGVTPRGRGMHPRNKYLEKAPDFEALAAQYPALRPYVKTGRKEGGRSWINWKDFNATRELTRVLLLHDFGVEWCLPDGHLCPPLPNRVNYLLWLEDLLTLHPATWHADRVTPVLGMDVGTGASCIYPLLGASMLSWHFVGTDVTAEGLHSARQNVQNNPHLSPLITIRDARAPTPIDPPDATCPSPDLNSCPSMSAPASCHPILLHVVLPGERFDFCMCNPPFFERMLEAGANPATACGGSVAEMVYPGGEVGFISEMIDDSAQMKQQIQWFSSLVGKKQHLKGLIARLRCCHVALIQTTEFVQGKTSRWGLAWSYTPLPPGSTKIQPQPQPRSKISFTLQGVGRQVAAWEVVLGMKAALEGGGAVCTLDAASFRILGSYEGASGGGEEEGRSTHSFRVEVFQQAPGSITVSATLLPPLPSDVDGVIQFVQLMERAEADIRSSFPTKVNRNR